MAVDVCFARLAAGDATDAAYVSRLAPLYQSEASDLDLAPLSSATTLTVVTSRSRKARSADDLPLSSAYRS